MISADKDVGFMNLQLWALAIKAGGSVKAVIKGEQVSA